MIRCCVGLDYLCRDIVCAYGGRLHGCGCIIWWMVGYAFRSNREVFRGWKAGGWKLKVISEKSKQHKRPPGGQISPLLSLAKLPSKLHSRSNLPALAPLCRPYVVPDWQVYSSRLVCRSASFTFFFIRTSGCVKFIHASIFDFVTPLAIIGNHLESLCRECGHQHQVSCHRRGRSRCCWALLFLQYAS